MNKGVRYVVYHTFVERSNTHMGTAHTCILFFPFPFLHCFVQLSRKASVPILCVIFCIP